MSAEKPKWCQDCAAWWTHSTTYSNWTAGYGSQRGHYTRGECRRKPPEVGGWPKIRGNDCCLEWQERPRG